MKEENKTKEQLIRELTELRWRISELETAQSEHMRSEEGQTLAVRILEGLNRPIPRMKPVDLDQFLSVVNSINHFWLLTVELPGE